MNDQELIIALDTLQQHEAYKTLLTHMEAMLGQQIQVTASPATGNDGHIDRDRHFMNTGMMQGILRVIELMKMENLKPTNP